MTVFLNYFAAWFSFLFEYLLTPTLFKDSIFQRLSYLPFLKVLWLRPNKFFVGSILKPFKFFLKNNSFKFYCFLFYIFNDFNFISILYTFSTSVFRVGYFFDGFLFKWVILFPSSWRFIFSLFVNEANIYKFKKLKFLKKKDKKISFFSKKKIVLPNVKKYFVSLSTNSFIFNENLNSIFFFLRKTKCFNKGRYSRNRQNYRTGFYWCLYVNVIALLGLNFLFYKFTINFGALWVFLFIFIVSFFFSKILKYTLFSISFFFNELKFILNFFKNLMLSFLFL